MPSIALILFVLILICLVGALKGWRIAYTKYMSRRQGAATNDDHPASAATSSLRPDHNQNPDNEMETPPKAPKRARLKSLDCFRGWADPELIKAMTFFFHKIILFVASQLCWWFTATAVRDTTTSSSIRCGTDWIWPTLSFPASCGLWAFAFPWPWSRRCREVCPRQRFWSTFLGWVNYDYFIRPVLFKYLSCIVGVMTKTAWLCHEIGHGILNCSWHNSQWVSWPRQFKKLKAPWN